MAGRYMSYKFGPKARDITVCGGGICVQGSFVVFSCKGGVVLACV